MKESDLKKELRKRLRDRGILWFPPKIKFYKQNDIFGAFDCLFYNGFNIDYIQITTITNISHRIKKIKDCFTSKNLAIPERSFVYAWDDSHKNFAVVTVREYLTGMRMRKFLNFIKK